MEGCRVLVNVYNVTDSGALAKLNQFTRDMLNSGGVFHAAVHVYGDVEWSFGQTGQGTGVYSSPPREDSQHDFREQIELGCSPLSESEFQQLLAEMMREWQGQDYNLLTRNCCSFSNQLCERLEV